MRLRYPNEKRRSNRRTRLKLTEMRPTFRTVKGVPSVRTLESSDSRLPQIWSSMISPWFIYPWSTNLSFWIHAWDCSKVELFSNFCTRKNVCSGLALQTRLVRGDVLFSHMKFVKVIKGQSKVWWLKRRKWLKTAFSAAVTHKSLSVKIPHVCMYNVQCTLHMQPLLCTVKVMKCCCEKYNFLQAWQF